MLLHIIQSFTSHLHGCVNWNIIFVSLIILKFWSHLHGCVNWNISFASACCARIRSHLHGCVNWNIYKSLNTFIILRRTFTGAWIETIKIKYLNFLSKSHLHGCVNWNSASLSAYGTGSKSHLHGCVNWNIIKLVFNNTINCRTFTGAWIETLFNSAGSAAGSSHLHGCVNWNKQAWHLEDIIEQPPVYVIFFETLKKFASLKETF